MLTFLECLLFSSCLFLSMPDFWLISLVLTLLSLWKWTIPDWINSKLRPCASHGWPVILLLSAFGSRNLLGNALGNLFFLALFSKRCKERGILVSFTIILVLVAKQEMKQFFVNDLIVSIGSWLACFVLVEVLPKNFSLAEAFVISNGSVNFLLVTWRDLNKDAVNVLNACLVGGTLSAAVFLSCHRFHFKSRKIYIRYSYAVTIALIGAVFYWWFQFMTTLDPIQYVVSFVVVYPNYGILIYWIAVLFVTFLMLPRLDLVSHEFRRKFFHFLSLALFIPATFLSPSFMSLAYKFSLTLFLLFSIVSNYSLPPFPQLHVHLTSFVTNDHRTWDATLILSHVYLLVGCALPLWMNISEGYVGIITVGMGDAVAALIGKRYGRHKWLRECQCHFERKSSDSNQTEKIGKERQHCVCLHRKSVKGTIAGCLSMCLLDALIQHFLIQQVASIWMRRSFLWIAAALLETILDHNDNLIVPLFCSTILLHF